MRDKKEKICCFWRWLILCIVRFPRLYALVWGIIILLALVCLKVDISRFVSGVI